LQSAATPLALSWGRVAPARVRTAAGPAESSRYGSCSRRLDYTHALAEIVNDLATDVVVRKRAVAQHPVFLQGSNAATSNLCDDLFGNEPLLCGVTFRFAIECCPHRPNYKAHEHTRTIRVRPSCLRLQAECGRRRYDGGFNCSSFLGADPTNNPSSTVVRNCRPGKTSIFVDPLVKARLCQN
jgi:hypothetical protein